MRINSARIKGYRIHKDTKVDFADGITLVSGPNESGKSTLAEAIRAALFVKARGRDTLHGRIGEGTTIELSLDVGDSRRAKVVKTFGGQGSVSVDISGAARMSDDDADRALAGILGGVEPLDRQRSTEGIDHVWGHLFVVQGRSGIMPVKDLSDGVRKDLRDALGRSSGGGSIVQSSEDGRVAEKVESIRDDLFTARGFRTGSAPQRAQAELETARETVEKARKAVEDRADLAGRIESAEHSLFEKDRQIGVVREKLDKARKALVGVKEAESELERFDHAAAEERKQWVRLSGLVEDLAKNDKEKGRLKTDKKRLQDEKEDIDSRCRSAESSRQTAFDELKAAKEVVSKEERDLAAVASRLREWDARQKREAAETDLEDIRSLRKELDSRQDAMDALQPVEKTDVAKAKDAEREALRERAALDALGVHLIPEPGGDSVEVDGAILPVGRETVLTDDFTLTVGGTSVRIVLGGREGRNQHEKALENARGKLKEVLDPFGCPDVAALERMAEEWAAAGQARDDARTKLNGRLAGRAEEEFVADVVETARVHEASRATLVRLELKPVSAEEVPGLRDRKEKADERLANLRDERERAETNEERLRGILETAKADALDKDSEIAQVRAAIKSLDTARTVLLRDWGGESEAFEADFKAARARAEQRDEDRRKLVAAVDELDPDGTRGDVEALTGNLDGLRTDRQKLQTKLDELRGAMMADAGASDPNAALRDAEAARDRAEAAFEVQRRRAESVRLLAEAFSAVRAEADRNLSSPLAEKAKPYFEILFGRDAGVALKGIADGTPELVLERTGGSYVFDDLSGGAAEQVSVALRLAMAEVLAGHFGGALPVILDDAFANSDADRVDKISRMLNTACDHGLQIIVLTCDPTRYSNLRAAARISLDNGTVV